MKFTGDLQGMTSCRRAQETAEQPIIRAIAGNDEVADTRPRCWGSYHHPTMTSVLYLPKFSSFKRCPLVFYHILGLKRLQGVNGAKYQSLSLVLLR